MTAKPDTTVHYSMNRRMETAEVTFDYEGNFDLRGETYNRVSLTTEEGWGGETYLFLSEYRLWHDGSDAEPCDVRGCCGNGGAR
jgi:hypothetical protein